MTCSIHRFLFVVWCCSGFCSSTARYQLNHSNDRREWCDIGCTGRVFTPLSPCPRAGLDPTRFFSAYDAPESRHCAWILVRDAGFQLVGVGRWSGRSVARPHWRVRRGNCFVADFQASRGSMVTSRSKSWQLARQEPLAVGASNTSAGHIHGVLGTIDGQLARNLGWPIDLDQFIPTGFSLA